MISAQLEHLEKYQNQRCLWCLVIIHQLLAGQFSILHVYESDSSRNRGLKCYQRDGKLLEKVYFTFEIPVDIYLNGARKYI